MHTWFDAQLDQKILDGIATVVNSPDRKEVGFTSFLFSGLTFVTLLNPPDEKLENSISVHCQKRTLLGSIHK